MWLTLVFVVCIATAFNSVQPAALFDDDRQHPYSMKYQDTPNHEADWEELAQKELDNALTSKFKIETAKNLILFIGDGMGPTTVTAARWMKAQRGQEIAKSHTVKLSWDEFPITGLAKTYNTDQITSDSAGTANAFVCGQKSRAGTIGVNQKVIRGQCSGGNGVAGNEIESMVTKAANESKWTGIVTTTRITHATPAAAYAHAADRDWESDRNIAEGDKDTCKDIAHQLIHGQGNDKIRVILGGGRTNFLPNTEKDPEYPDVAGNRLDNENLINTWIEKHKDLEAKYVANQSEFDDVKTDETDYLFGLFEPSHMQYEVDRANDTWGEPSLAEMVEKSIKLLERNDNGFVLYVEGGRIDHAHHDGIAYRALDEVLALEEAVAKAVEMTDDDDTLIVVTADHSHPFVINGYSKIEADIFGLDAEWGDDDKPYLTLGYGNGPGAHVHRTNDSARLNLTEQNAPPLNEDMEARMNYLQDAAVPLQWDTHGGEDVAVYATGPMAHLLSGTYEQSYIPHAMMYSACFGNDKTHCSRSASPALRVSPLLALLTLASLASLLTLT